MNSIVGNRMMVHSEKMADIYRRLKKGEKYEPYILCKSSTCRAGWIWNILTNKKEICPNCKGYGFIRKN